MARHSAYRNHAEAALVRLLLLVLRLLPFPVALRLARAITKTLDLLIPRLRRTAYRNLELALPQTPEAERRRIADGCFRSLARLLAVLARMPGIQKQEISRWIRYEGFEHYEAAKRQGRGVLFATAHLGNWEFSAFAHALLTEPMSFVVRPLDNPLLDDLTDRYRTLAGNRTLGRGRDYLRPLVEALKRNEAVGILVDQNVTADRGIFVDFFGNPACVDGSFARLAFRTGAAVIPGYAIWSEEECRYILRFDAPIPMTGDAQADTQAVHRALETAIRSWPDQWLWIHRRWKTRPPGEPPLY